MGMFMLFPILLLGGGLGGANELLDYVDTQAYWKAKSTEPTVAGLVAMIDAAPKAEDISALIKQLGSDDFEKREEATEKIAEKGAGVIPQLKEATKSSDPEIADRATRLIAQLSGGDTDPGVHKLMVIRTLGELKDKSALPALKAQLNSKEPFVAAHAKRAIAAIKGTPYKPAMPGEEAWDKDVWMLPKGIRMVVQLTMPGGGPIDWSKALDNLAGPVAPQNGKEGVMKEMQAGILIGLNHVGNVRIDGITMGVSGDPGPQSGFMTVFVRGQYDREKAKATFAKLKAEVGTEEGMMVATPPNAGMKILLPSDELLVIVGGPPGGTLPVKDVIAAIKSGKGAIVEDTEIAALIKTANRKTGGWAVAQMTETYKQAKWLAGFESIIAERVSEKGKTTVKFTGTGKDADLVAASVTDLNTNIAQLREMFGKGGAGGFIPKPMIDFVNSIEVKQTGASATMTGTFEGDFNSILGSMLWPLAMIGGPGF